MEILEGVQCTQCIVLHQQLDKGCADKFPLSSFNMFSPVIASVDAIAPFARNCDGFSSLCDDGCLKTGQKIKALLEIRYALDTPKIIMCRPKGSMRWLFRIKPSILVSNSCKGLVLKPYSFEQAPFKTH